SIEDVDVNVRADQDPQAHSGEPDRADQRILQHGPGEPAIDDVDHECAGRADSRGFGRGRDTAPDRAEHQHDENGERPYVYDGLRFLPGGEPRFRWQGGAEMRLDPAANHDVD